MKSPNVGFREGGSLDPRESRSWTSGLGVTEDGVDLSFGGLEKVT